MFPNDDESRVLTPEELKELGIELQPGEELTVGAVNELFNGRGDDEV